MKGFKPRPDAPHEADRTLAATKAYLELRRRILHGELPAGTQLNEIETAADLAVSRTPVREALRELLNDGLVHEGPRRQCVVSSGSPELEHEIRIMRVALESVAVREAAGTTDPTGADLLRLTMIRMNRALQAEDLARALDCDDEFHVQIAHVAHLPLIADTVHRLRGLTRLVGLTHGWELPVLQQSVPEHEAIIDAIESGDPDLAVKALTTHLA